MPTFKVKPSGEATALPFSTSVNSQLSEQGGCDSKQLQEKTRAKSSPSETIRDFALNVSSAHGLPNIFRASTKLGRVVWTLIFLAAFSVAIWQGTVLVVNFFNYQVTAEVKIVTRPSLEFPSVTVCNTNKLRQSAIGKSKHRQMLIVDQAVSLPYYVPCVDGDFLCRDRPVCIKGYLLCDGIRQCGEFDTSDEEHCDYDFGSCGNDQFRCIYSGSRWGLCIPSEKKCDRTRDCYEGEDEDDCECKSLEFKCKTRGGCIPKSVVCDGIPNCLDGSDEYNCLSNGVFQCDDTSFQCALGTSCIPQPYVCDTYYDCPDGSDENPTTCEAITTTPPPSCDYNQFDCGGNQCIPGSWLCDSIVDCHSGEDESEMLCGRVVCGSDEIQCATGGGCGYPCDLYPECLDGSDEKNCVCGTIVGYVYSGNEVDFVQFASCSGTYARNFSNIVFDKYYITCNDSSPVQSSSFTCIEGVITCYNPSTNIMEPCKTVYPECYTSPNGQDYSGKSSSHACVPWSDDRVASLGYTGSVYSELEDVEPGSTVEHSFCRNPGGERENPWCFAVNLKVPGDSIRVFNCTVDPPRSDCTGESSLLSRYRRYVESDSVTPWSTSSVPGNYSNTFYCQSGEGIPFWQTCNGFPDCQDGSDEWNNMCGDIVSECDINQFQCRETGGNSKCIPSRYVCDNYTDCGNEPMSSNSTSDEARCVTRGEPRPANYYLCANGHKMLHEYDICNTVYDCHPQGDDEFACTWKNGTGEMQNPFEDPEWYSPYKSLIDSDYWFLFSDFPSFYRGRPFNRVKGEDPPDWNGFVTFSTTPDYSDLIDVPKLSRDEVHLFGHQKADFILQCAYQEEKCNFSNIEEFQDDTYGNCFTFNPSGDLSASKTGSRFGLQMTLFLEQSEYISIYGQEAGVRVSITPSHIRPNPTDNGFAVKPGAVTSIGLRYSFVNRQPSPYGECETVVENSPIIDNGVVRESTASEKYDRGLCKKTCLHQHILEQCGCSDTLELDGERCKILDKKQDVCKELMYFLHQNDNLTCECPQQCSEVYYKKTTSTSSWPSKNFVKHLLKTLHSLNKKTKILNENNIFDNNVRLEVYYEELNYESTTEVPAYQSSALFGDIGGIVGLYVGFSVITLCEFFSVIMTLIKHALYD